jgi:SprT-like family
MSTAKPTKEQFGAYEAMAAYFNRALFENALPPVVLGFARRRRMRGHFAPERWGKGRERAHEISLNPDDMARGPRAVASTLVHEMVHLWQCEHGSPGRRGYHNAQWARKMIAVGLVPSSTGKPGGKQTGESVSHYVKAGGAFALAWEAMPKKNLIPWRGRYGYGKTRSKIPYRCPNPNCPTTVWGKPGLRVACVECGGVELLPPPQVPVCEACGLPHTLSGSTAA